MGTGQSARLSTRSRTQLSSKRPQSAGLALSQVFSWAASRLSSSHVSGRKSGLESCQAIPVAPGTPHPRPESPKRFWPFCWRVRRRRHCCDGVAAALVASARAHLSSAQRNASPHALLAPAGCCPACISLGHGERYAYRHRLGQALFLRAGAGRTRRAGCGSTLSTR